MMQSKLRGNEKLEQVDLNGDVVELLKMAQGACREMTTNASLHDAIDETKRRYYIYKQKSEYNNEQHLKTFKSNTEVVKHYEGSLFDDKVLIKYERDQNTKKIK